jgi:hypothetical protein
VTFSPPELLTTIGASLAALAAVGAARTSIHLLRATRQEASEVALRNQALVNSLRDKLRTGQPDDRTTDAEAKTIAVLLETVQDAQRAVLRVGQVVVIKTPSQTLARSLTPAEAKLLDDNPAVLEDPELTISVLSGRPAQRG